MAPFFEVSIDLRDDTEDPDGAQGKETEHNWAPRERSVLRIRGMLRGHAHTQFPQPFVAGLKGGLMEGISKTVSGFNECDRSAAESADDESADDCGSTILRGTARACRVPWVIPRSLCRKPLGHLGEDGVSGRGSYSILDKLTSIGVLRKRSSQKSPNAR